MNRRTDDGYDALLRPGKEPPLAAHFVTPRTLYGPRSVRDGGDPFIRDSGLAHGVWRGAVEEVSLECLARCRDIGIRPGSPRCDSRQLVDRAHLSQSERGYRRLMPPSTLATNRVN